MSLNLTLNIKALYGFDPYDPSGLLGISGNFQSATPGLSPNFYNFSGVIDTIANHGSGVFTSPLDAINYYAAVAMTSMVNDVNTNGNSRLTASAGALVSVDDTILSALTSKLIRTTSPLTGLSIVTSTSAGGTQISSAKDSTVHISVSDSITTNIGGTSTETLIAEICATNSTTAADWVEAERVGDSQSITLALALQSIQPGYRAISFDVPAGYYMRVREVSAGTHSGSIIAGQKTIYG